jgi:Zn-dependent protease with chaperone function
MGRIGGVGVVLGLLVLCVPLAAAQKQASTSADDADDAAIRADGVYLVVSHGASRLQEVLADRWAIRAYGSQAFISGFTRVVERSIYFDEHVQTTLRHVIEQSRPLPNLYRHEPEAAQAPQAAKAEQDADASAAPPDRAERVRQEMEREPSAYDSHPPPRQRLTWADAMAVERAPRPDDEVPAWDLFEDREDLERQMTAQVRDAIAANHGVAITG